MEVDPNRCSPIYPPERIDDIRKNVLNFIKNWIQFHIGPRTVKLLLRFLNRIHGEYQSGQLERFISVILTNLQSTNDDKFVETSHAPPSVRDPHLLFRPMVGLLDPDALEIARQLTLIYHEKYRAIQSREFMIGISERSTTIQTPTLTEFFCFGNFVTRIFAEAFLKATSKEAAYAKILEICRCLGHDPTPGAENQPNFHCSNWEAISCLGQFLYRGDVRRLAGRGDSLPPDLPKLWVECGEDCQADPGRAQYNAIIEKRASGWNPTIPNMHIELKGGSKASREQPDMIGGLVNWAKLQPLATKCKVLSVFQKKKYPFVLIPQIQRIILHGPEMPAAELEDKLDEAARLLPKE
jgi:hypothetical protein